MYALIPRTMSPAVGEPSPLLSHLAGEFAPRVAGLWRAPHAVFLTAPAERRHLVCLALTEAGERPLPGPADALLEFGVARALDAFVEAPPQGLQRALSRLGETAWTAADYAALKRLLGVGPTMKALRHAKVIPIDQVRALALLPEPLLAAGLGRFSLNAAQARLLAETWLVVARLHGPEEAAAAAGRWALADDTKGLFQRAQLDVTPEPASPPFPGTTRLRPLLTRDQMRDAASRYRNCLRDRIRFAATGDAAYYEWLEAPGAIVEISRDHLYGWRLDEARAPRNKPVSRETQAAISAELREMGVHVGLSGWRVENALEEAWRKDYAAPDVPGVVTELYGE